MIYLSLKSRKIVRLTVPTFATKRVSNNNFSTDIYLQKYYFSIINLILLILKSTSYRIITLRSELTTQMNRTLFHLTFKKEIKGGGKVKMCYFCVAATRGSCDAIASGPGFA